MVSLMSGGVYEAVSVEVEAYLAQEARRGQGSSPAQTQPAQALCPFAAPANASEARVLSFAELRKRLRAKHGGTVKQEGLVQPPPQPL